MLAKLRHRLTYANVVSTICLCLVVGGGTAYAANTVFSTDIADGEVKNPDLGADAIGPAKIADNSLSATEFKTNSLGSRVVTGLTGLDIVDDSLGNGDFLTGSVNSRVVTDNELTGADVADSSTLGSQDILEEGLLFNNTLNINDIGSQAVGADEVVNDSLLSSDLKASSVGSDEVTNSSLNDEDISQSTHTDFQVSIGILSFFACKTVSVTGIPAGGDHLVLTANTTNAHPDFTYQPEYTPGGADGLRIKACNPTDTTQDDGITNFNLLVIDAQ